MFYLYDLIILDLSNECSKYIFSYIYLIHNFIFINYSKNVDPEIKSYT